MRILLPGQRCPAWLERIEFEGPGPHAMHRVDCLSVVTTKEVDGALSFSWRPVFPARTLLRVDGDGARNVTVVGQSPAGGDGTVYLYTEPVIGWPVLALAGAFCSYLLGRG